MKDCFLVRQNRFSRRNTFRCTIRLLPGRSVQDFSTWVLYIKLYHLIFLSGFKKSEEEGGAPLPAPFVSVVESGCGLFTFTTQPGRPAKVGRKQCIRLGAEASNSKMNLKKKNEIWPKPCGGAVLVTTYHRSYFTVFLVHDRIEKGGYVRTLYRTERRRNKMLNVSRVVRSVIHLEGVHKYSVWWVHGPFAFFRKVRTASQW